MIMNTDYRRKNGAGPSGGGAGGGTGKLMNYINKEEGVKDRQGNAMNEEERNEFVQDSKNQEMQRRVSLSPTPAAGEEMSDEELELRTRQTMDDYLRNKPESTYCYAVDREKDHPHTDVILTGSEDDLKMYDEEREELQETAEERFRDVEERAERQSQQTAQQAAQRPSQRQRMEGD